MPYIENPKTKGSGILCAIPQTGKCSNNCKDCFFQSGRSYLEPLEDNLPNLPPEDTNYIVRVNDGHDSSLDYPEVEKATKCYKNKFYNTSLIGIYSQFDAPFVLTLNPNEHTDNYYYEIIPPENLMFVRLRVNMWNLYNVVFPATEYYASWAVPVVYTFMAYHKESDIPERRLRDYSYRRRTSNSYYAIKEESWRIVMDRFRGTKYEKYISTCGKIEGEYGDTHCRFCGTCLREYFATKVRMETKK